MAAAIPDYRTLRVERDGPHDRLLLNRPDRLNGMNIEMVDELVDYFGRLQFDDSVRVVTVRGAGRAFCAGLDMRYRDPDKPRVPEESMIFQRKLAEIVTRMRRCPQPIVALLNGAAAGGGFALALASDVRIAVPATRMNAAFIRIGLSACDVGTSYFLPRLVGVSVASELMLTGRFIDAERSLRVGLVSEIVPEDQLIAAGDRLVAEMLATAPMGLRLTKECLDAALAMENRNQMLCAQSGDFQEGMRAFLEKRPPVYARPK